LGCGVLGVPCDHTGREVAWKLIMWGGLVPSTDSHEPFFALTADDADFKVPQVEAVLRQMLKDDPGLADEFRSHAINSFDVDWVRNFGHTVRVRAGLPDPVGSGSGAN
jgi:hypothetical protein